MLTQLAHVSVSVSVTWSSGRYQHCPSLSTYMSIRKLTLFEIAPCSELPSIPLILSPLNEINKYKIITIWNILEVIYARTEIVTSIIKIYISGP